MKIVRFLGLAAASMVLIVAVAGCQPDVEVRTGQKVECPYGHTVTDGVRKVKVPASDIGKYQVETVSRVCTEHAQTEKLYAQAQDALAAGDMAKAKAALEQVVAVDAGFKMAATQLAQLGKGEKPQPDSSAGIPSGSSASTSTPSSTKPGDGDPSSPAGSLLKWAPDTLEGFTAEDPTIDVLSIAREYVPGRGAKPTSMVIVAEQFRTPAAAKAALKAQLRNGYPSDRATVEIGGRKGTFGTDGRRFAALGFSDGSVMIVIEMGAAEGAEPGRLKGGLTAVAEQLP